jgi:hypothetical protein
MARNSSSLIRCSSNSSTCVLLVWVVRICYSAAERVCFFLPAFRDTSIEPSALTRNVTRAFRYVRALGPRSIRVRDDSGVTSSGSGSGSAAGGHKRHVGINPCLACTTELNRSSNGGGTSSTTSKFDHFFTGRPNHSEGFDAALIFTPRLGEDTGRQLGSMTAGAQQQGSTQQVRNWARTPCAQRLVFSCASQGSPMQPSIILQRMWQQCSKRHRPTCSQRSNS